MCDIKKRHANMQAYLQIKKRGGFRAEFYDTHFHVH